MKKVISFVLAIFVAASFGVTAFANEITPYRYEPCPYYGNPLFEHTTYSAWVDTGVTRPRPGGYAGQYDMQQTRTVYIYWQCGSGNCPRSDEYSYTETRWRQL